MSILRLYPLILTLSSLLACSHSALVQAAVPEDISPVVSSILADVDAPAMGAVVTSSQAVLAVGVDGVRKQGEDVPVLTSDAFHIGSVAKTMTATLAGILVESGDLQWDTRVADLFPDAVASGRPEYRAITLAQLLAHESGLRQLTSDEEIATLPALEGDIHEQRLVVLDWLLSRPPAGEVGEEYVYSNGGFVVAAAMMEAVTGESWETLMRTRLFEPLNMDSAGFGWPGKGSDEETGFIWGHRLIAGRRVVMHPDGDYQLPEALAPAGDVHASLPDMAAYAASYLRAWREEDALLTGGTVRRMYERRLNSALGWGVQAMMGHDPVAVYVGSADTFLVMIAIIPESDRAVVVAANAADEETEAGVIALLKAMIESHVPAPEERPLAGLPPGSR